MIGLQHSLQFVRGFISLEPHQNVSDCRRLNGYETMSYLFFLYTHDFMYCFIFITAESRIFTENICFVKMETALLTVYPSKYTSCIYCGLAML